MKLEHYFRLIVISIFQGSVAGMNKSIMGEKMSYDNQYFFCPKIHCKDGFNVSLQIHNGNYCSSENGYRTMGVDWKKLEFGFPSMNEKDMWKHSEMWGRLNWDDEGEEIPFDETGFDETGFDVTRSVGIISIEEMQAICEKHGGIDWDVTLSKENANKFLNP